MTLRYIITELGRNQNVQQTLYDEINNVIKPDEKLTQENVYKIPYLKMILKETLRYILWFTLKITKMKTLLKVS